MYQRRVQVTGGGTYLVTLPKEWAETHGATTGVVVTLVTTASGTLVVVPERVRLSNRCLVPVEGQDFDRLQRELISRYVAGYDVIEATGDRIGPGQRRMVREIAQRLVGVEIFEETQSTVVLHCLVNVREFPVQQTLHRTYEMARTMLADAVSAFVQRDEELARDVVERDADVDRLVLLVARQFGLLLRDLLTEEDVSLSRLQFLHAHTAVVQLERVADHAAKISQAALTLRGELKASVTEKVLDLASASSSLLAQAVEAFESLDGEKANGVLQEKAESTRLAEQARATASADQPDSAHAISLAMDSLLRVREYGFNIAESALDARAVAQPDRATSA